MSSPLSWHLRRSGGEVKVDRLIPVFRRADLAPFMLLKNREGKEASFLWPPIPPGRVSTVLDLQEVNPGACFILSPDGKEVLASYVDLNAVLVDFMNEEEAREAAQARPRRRRRKRDARPI